MFADAKVPIGTFVQCRLPAAPVEISRREVTFQIAVLFFQVPEIFLFVSVPCPVGPTRQLERAGLPQVSLKGRDHLIKIRYLALEGAGFSQIDRLEEATRRIFQRCDLGVQGSPRP